MVADPYITFTTHVPTEMEVAADIIHTDPYLVAEEGSRVLGYAYYRQFRGGPGYVHTMEHSVHLAPGATGQGIGRALMAALEACAVAGGVHVLVAAIGAGNEGSIRFHSGLGFVETGRMPEVGRKGGRWHDLVLMQKRLDP
jgi:phosphinothricin acetyltransferase